MKAKWIAVVERSQARLFRNQPFSLRQLFKNELGREKNKAMTTDRPDLSRARSSQASSTYSLGAEKSPHEDAAKQFARKIAHLLEKRFPSIKTGELLIASEPKMTGYLRHSMKESFQNKIEWTKRDLGHFSSKEIREYFAT